MLETRRIMASIDPSYEVEGPRYDVNQLMEVASTPAGRAARTTASGQMLTLTELQTRLEFAALLETRRRMERRSSTTLGLDRVLRDSVRVVEGASKRSQWPFAGSSGSPQTTKIQLSIACPKPRSARTARKSP